MFRAFFLSLLISNHLIAKECTRSEVQEHQDKIHFLKEDIQKWIVLYNLNEEIDELEKETQACDQLQSESVPASQLEEWKKVGAESEIKRWRREIEFSSHFRDVSKDIEEYKEVVKDRGAGELKSRSFIGSAIYRGLRSQKKMEKSCSTIDFSKKFGEARNQTDSGWCFAFASADLLSYKIDKRLSALDLVSKYYDYNPNSNKNRRLNNKSLHQLEGGFSDEAVKIGLLHGVCLEKDVKVPDYDAGVIESFQHMESIRDAYDRGNCSDRDAIVNNPANQFIVSQFFPKKFTQDVMDIFSGQKKNPGERTIFDQPCEPQFYSLKAEVVSQCENNNELNPDLIKKIAFKYEVDAQLENKNPVLIGFHSSVLTENQIGYSNESNHVAIIVGRKFNPEKNQCEYLLRDSAGKNCAGTDSVFACRDGNEWVPQDLLIGSATSISYITP